MKCKVLQAKAKRERGSKLGYWCIIFMHDNPLFNLFKDPVKKLKSAGLKEGMKVLEVGCGPGFYTIPAANIVGEKGKVWAMDLHTGFIRRVERKVRQEALKNVAVIDGNAANTSFAPASLDLAFLFGLGHISGGLEPLIKEMSRIIRQGGSVAFETGHGRDEKIIKVFKKHGFGFDKRERRVMLFRKV